LARIIADTNIPMERVEKAFDLQVRVMEKQAEIDFNTAMWQFQQRKEVIAHNRQGIAPGGVAYGYSDYPKMVREVTPWLEEVGLSFTHRKDPPVIENGRIVMVMVYCIISHSSGHSREFPYPALPDEKLQGKLSPMKLLQQSITSAKRQSLAEGLGLATSDDHNDEDSTSYTELVSEQKAADILAKIDEVGADRAKFLSWASKAFKVPIEREEDIPAKCADDALRELTNCPPASAARKPRSICISFSRSGLSAGRPSNLRPNG
jgi:hypothetical protein